MKSLIHSLVLCGTILGFTEFSSSAMAQEIPAEPTASALQETSDASETEVIVEGYASADEAAKAGQEALETIPEVLQGHYVIHVTEDDNSGAYSFALQSLEDFKSNNLWIMIAACMVFIMHLGFACVETGLTRSKNTVNILFKNIMIVMIGIVMYGICGWMIMYPGNFNGFFAWGTGISGGGEYSGGTAEYLSDKLSPRYNPGYTVWADFFFQAMFAATCCTIISGAVAGRIKLLPFLLFCVPFVGIIYPMTGSWQWGEGWLYEMEFTDFAGSTLVHAVGGAGALAGVILLGARKGKYGPDGKPYAIPGHSMPLAAIGVFLLWFGWYGFNGGSELSADPAGVSYVLVTTTFAACGGGLTCAILSWIVGKGKPDLSMTLNGILAGLVGVTAGPDAYSWIEALTAIGMVSGALCFGAVLLIDRLRLDDPVGAISVHGVCGIYGTIAVGLFGVEKLGVQILGTLTIAAVAFIAAFIFFVILKYTIGIRVSEEEELQGLDIGEHGMEAYAGFQTFPNS